MKKQQFEQFVSQYYNIQHPKPITLGSDKLRQKMIRHLDTLTSKDDWEEDPETVELVEEIQASLAPKPNPTLPFEITGIKEGTRTCPDCSRPCKLNRKVTSQLYFTPQKHWRHSCNFCKQTQNPDTKEFNLNNKSVAAFFQERFKNRDK